MTADRRVLAPGGAGLAQARERFLAVDTMAPQGVRQAIVASWWRSREADVAADRLQLQYVRNPDLDTPLTRSAEPVLCRLRDQLDGPAWCSAGTRPTRRWSGSWTGSRSRRASATPRRWSAPTASARPWRPAGRCTCSATSTTPRTSRSWPVRACPSGTRCRARPSASST